MTAKTSRRKRADPSDYAWSKFRWRDWQGDPALRMCSPAARGVWMDMLAIMFEATPRGHLLVNGKQPTDGQLASVFGIPEKQARILVLELDSAGVFSRTAEGVMFNRRMVRDKEASDAGRAHGLTGGNPALKSKEVDSTRGDDGEGNGGGLTPPDNGGAYTPPISGGLNLEERYPSDKKEPPSLRSGPPCEAGDIASAKPPPMDSRGTRLPQSWIPSERDRAFAAGLGLQADDVAEEFRAYWCALPGKSARKLDWSMTFQNRCRDVAARRKPPAGKQNGWAEMDRRFNEMQSEPDPFAGWPQIGGNA